MNPLLLQATTAAPELVPGITQAESLAGQLSTAGILLLVLYFLYRAYQQKDALVQEKDKQNYQLFQQMAQMQADNIRAVEKFQSTIDKTNDLLAQNTAVMQKMYEKQL